MREKSKHRYVLDRLEGNVAVCEAQESGDMRNFPLDALPAGVREGDAFYEENGALCPDPEYARQRRETVQKKFDALWESET